MAKKNKVILMGFVNEIVEGNEDTIEFKLRIQKNAKRFIFPTIRIENVKLKPDNGINFHKLQKNALVQLKGEIRTVHEINLHECLNKECNHEIEERYLRTYIEAQTITFLKENQSNPYENVVIQLGTICNEPKLGIIQGTRSPLAKMTYQLAVNQKNPLITDYPWINSFARQAEIDAKYLDVSSQIMVDGVLNTRKISRTYTCECCGEETTVSQELTEVNANTVEYLNNCNFGKGSVSLAG